MLRSCAASNFMRDAMLRRTQFVSSWLRNDLTLTGRQDRQCEPANHPCVKATTAMNEEQCDFRATSGVRDRDAAIAM